MYRFSLVLFLLISACTNNSNSKATSSPVANTTTTDSKEATSQEANATNNSSIQPDHSAMEQPSSTSNLDNRIFGTWKNTEVISSGSGDSYGSFSSETFIEFTADGVFSTWQGQSAGSGGGQSFESSGSSQKQSAKYRTEGKMIVFMDPSNGQEAKTQYMVDEGRLLLSDGGSNKKIYLRVE